MGSFYYGNHRHAVDRINQLVKYVTSLPSKFDIKLNGFCCYHKKEFDRLTDANERHAQTLWYADNGR